MNYTRERIPAALFREDGHYLGRPADAGDRIVSRRLRMVQRIPGFIGADLTLLDAGCGNGASMLALAAHMKYCLGVDVTDEHFPRAGQGNCTFLRMDMERDAPPEQFDRVISFEVIEHLEREESVRFYYDALKDGGLMAISVPNKWWVFETHGAKLPLLPWNRVPFFSWLPRPVHERLANARIYTKGRIVRLLERHGFTVLSTDYIMAPMDVLPDGAFKRFVLNRFFYHDTTRIPFKSTSIFVLAKKEAGNIFPPTGSATL